MSDGGGSSDRKKKREAGVRHRGSVEGVGKGDWLCSRRF